MYYNRARYYDPSNGRFNRTDPYAGNTQDPQSLHKYLYCHANPINAIDPSGQMAFTIGFTIAGILAALKLGAIVLVVIIVVKILTEGRPRDSELISATARLKRAVTEHKSDIYRYAVDHGLTHINDENDVPNFPCVQESYRLGLGPRLADEGYMFTNPITNTISVNHWWLKREDPGHVTLCMYLAHEYGHTLYGHWFNFFGLSRGYEDEASDFAIFLCDIIKEEDY